MRHLSSSLRSQAAPGTPVSPRVRTLLKASTLTLALLLSACAEVPAQGQTAPAPAVVSASFNPSRLVFSAVKTETTGARTLVLSNTGSQPLTVSALTLNGTDAAGFLLDMPPTLPLTVNAGASVTLALKFSPQGRVGVMKASLRADVSGSASLSLNLSGLSAQALEGENEPPLAQVVEALGYTTNVGGTQLVLGTSASPLGQEVSAPLFRKSGSGPVSLRPVARYSPSGPLEFGLFTLQGGQPTTHAVGVVGDQQYQTLNPVYQSSAVTFDPGSEAFGVYTGATAYSKAADYSQDSLNKGFMPHAMRIYPVITAEGKVQSEYLVTLEASSNGDYQDAVFLLSGAEPAQP